LDWSTYWSDLVGMWTFGDPTPTESSSGLLSAGNGNGDATLGSAATSSVASSVSSAGSWFSSLLPSETEVWVWVVILIIVLGLVAYIASRV